jgi:hypothetical protein
MLFANPRHAFFCGRRREAPVGRFVFSRFVALGLVKTEFTPQNRPSTPPAPRAERNPPPTNPLLTQSFHHFDQHHRHLLQSSSYDCLVVIKSGSSLYAIEFSRNSLSALNKQPLSVGYSQLIHYALRQRLFLLVFSRRGIIRTNCTAIYDKSANLAIFHTLFSRVVEHRAKQKS